MSARKSSHRTIFLIVSSGSPLALIASSPRSTSKKPLCPMTRSLHPPITACGHRVRFVGSWREEFFEVPISLEDEFWKGLNEIASEQGMILAEPVRTIDANRNHANLSSAIRLFVLGVYRD